MKENSLNIKEVKEISCCVWPSLGWVLRLQEVEFLGRTDTSNSWSKGVPGVGEIGGEPLNFTWYNNLITQLHKRQKAAGASGWIQDFPACKHKCFSVCMPMHACVCVRERESIRKCEVCMCLCLWSPVAQAVWMCRSRGVFKAKNRNILWISFSLAFYCHKNIFSIFRVLAAFLTLHLV